MKKSIAVVGLSAIVASIVAADADAGPGTSTGSSANRGVTRQSVLATKIVGKITVPAPPTGELAGFACSNIIVTATSKEHLPPPGPNAFTVPKWERSIQATGTYSSGFCNYSLVVPGNSAFYLTAGGSGNFACHYIGTYIAPSGAGLGPITVAHLSSKTQDFSITAPFCGYIN